MGLLTEAILNGVSGVTGICASTLARPKPRARTSVVSRNMATASPGMRSERRSESNRVARSAATRASSLARCALCAAFAQPPNRPATTTSGAAESWSYSVVPNWRSVRGRTSVSSNVCNSAAGPAEAAADHSAQRYLTAAETLRLRQQQLRVRPQLLDHCRAAAPQFSFEGSWPASTWRKALSRPKETRGREGVSSRSGRNRQH